MSKLSFGEKVSISAIAIYLVSCGQYHGGDSNFSPAKDSASTNLSPQTSTTTPSSASSSGSSPVPSGTPEPSSDPLPSATPLPSHTPKPSWTPIPSTSPFPSVSPVPTIMPLPSSSPAPGGSDGNNGTLSDATCADLGYQTYEAVIEQTGVTGPMIALARPQGGIVIANLPLTGPNSGYAHTSIYQYDAGLKLLQSRAMPSSHEAWSPASIGFNPSTGSFLLGAVFNAYAPSLPYSLHSLNSSLGDNTAFGNSGYTHINPVPYYNEYALAVAPSSDANYIFKQEMNNSIVINGSGSSSSAPTASGFARLSHSGQVLGLWPQSQDYIGPSWDAAVFAKPWPGGGAVFAINGASQTGNGNPQADLFLVNSAGATLIAHTGLSNVSDLIVQPDVRVVVVRGILRGTNGNRYADRFFSQTGDLLATLLEPATPQGASLETTIENYLAGLGTPKTSLNGSGKVITAMVSKFSTWSPSPFVGKVPSGKTLRNYNYYVLSTKTLAAVNAGTLASPREFCIRTEKTLTLNNASFAVADQLSGAVSGRVYYVITGYRYFPGEGVPALFTRIYSAVGQVNLGN